MATKNEARSDAALRSLMAQVDSGYLHSVERDPLAPPNRRFYVVYASGLQSDWLTVDQAHAFALGMRAVQVEDERRQSAATPAIYVKEATS